MFLDSKVKILGSYAGPVVFYGNPVDSSAAGFYDDFCCAGIQGILGQFLDHRRGAIDDLSGRDSIDEQRRQRTDSTFLQRRFHKFWCRQPGRPATSRKAERI